MRIVIIDTYPSGRREINILKDCVDAYRKSECAIMVVTHHPINISEINADFVIYDKNNDFLPANYTPFFWLSTGNFRVEVYNAGHTLPICRNISNALHLCQSLGYREFIFTEADVILSESDRCKLFELMDTMNASDKKMLFFRPEDYRDCGGSYVYETLFFGGITDYFLNTFRPPLNIEQWLSIPMGYTLELSFYERFSHDEDKFLIINDHSSNYFKNSSVNLLRYGLFNCELLLNDNDNQRPVLFIMNSLISGKPMSVKIEHNNSVAEVVLHKNQYWINSYENTAGFVNVVVIDDGEVFLEKHFRLDSNPEELKKKGTIKYN